MNRPILAAMVLMLLAGSTSFAQDEAPRYIDVFTSHTKLGQQAEYEAAVKDLWAAMKKAGGDFPANPQHVSLIESLFPFQACLQRLATQQLHGDKRNAAIFSHLMDRNDIVVFDQSGRLGLSNKTFFCRLAGRQRRFHPQPPAHERGRGAPGGRANGAADDPGCKEEAFSRL